MSLRIFPVGAAQGYAGQSMPLGGLEGSWVGRRCCAAQISGRSSSSALPGSWKETARTKPQAHSPNKLFDRDDIGEADVDVLTALSLMTVDGDDVFSGLKRLFGSLVERDHFVIGSVTSHGGAQNTVKVNFCILVVVDVELQIGEFARRHFELETKPDVRCVPFRSNPRPRSAARAEAGGIFLPHAGIEVRFEPVRSGFRGGVAPARTLVYGCRQNVHP